MRGMWVVEVRALVKARGHAGTRGPNGRPLCHWCGVEVPPRHRRWCGGEACHRMVNALWGGPRVWVNEMLAPECVRCGLDVVAMAERIRRLPRRPVTAALGRLGFDLHRALWDADHIIPLDEGGRDSPDNIQRLCVPCHKEKTAEQAARRKRRPRKRVAIHVGRVL